MTSSRDKSGTLAAASDHVDLSCAGYGGLGIRLSGTFVGTVTFQGSVDGRQYDTLTVLTFDGSTTATTATSTGQWLGTCSGLTVVRVTMTAYTSGTAVAYLLASGPTGIAVGGGGSGSIGGSIAATQIAYGSGSNTIAGSANLTWSGTALNLGAQTVGAQVVAQFSGGDFQVNLSDPSHTKFLIGFTGNNAILRLWDNSNVETVNVNSSGASYLNGGTVTISNLAASASLSNVLFSSNTGLLKAITGIAYDPAYGGRFGGGISHASIVTVSGINVNCDRTGAGNPLVSFASFTNVSSGTNLSAITQSTAMKGEVYDLNTETHDIGSWEAGDFYCDHRGTGSYGPLIGMSGYVQVSGAATGDPTTGVIVGCLAIPHMSNVGAVSLRTVGFACDPSDGGNVTFPTAGATTDFIAFWSTGMGLSGTWTATNRYAFKIDAMAGAAATNDFAIYSLATQNSLIAGPLSLGINATVGGVISMQGLTSGSAVIKPPSVAGSPILTWGMTTGIIQAGLKTRVTAQSAANASICTVTVFSGADQSFHVSMNMNVSASTTLVTTMTCTYTDENSNARTMIFPVTQLSGSFIAAGAVTGTGAWETPVLHIRCKANTAITLLTSAGTFTGVTYTAEGLITQV